MKDDIIIDGHKVEKTYDGEVRIGPYTFSKDGKSMSIDSNMFSFDNGVSGHEIDIQASIGYAMYKKYMQKVKPRKKTERPNMVSVTNIIEF